MKFPSTTAALLAACSVMTAAAQAASGPRHDCARVTDDAARLACYDQAFGRPAQPPPPAAPAPTAVPEAQPAEAPVATGEEFGFKRGEIERAKNEDEKPPALDSITAKVTEVESRRGQFTATLDNGQVWSQIEINSKVQLEAGDTVTVRRAVFGSYLLTGPQGVATRVRRVR
jgi:hypothetical protein